MSLRLCLLRLTLTLDVFKLLIAYNLHKKFLRLTLTLDVFKFIAACPIVQALID